MKNNITFQPLIPSSSGIFCHLLSINNTKLVINCGGHSSFYTQDIISIINSCDCILITSFDYECIEGLWFILSQGFFKPVYMSVPVKEFSMIFQEIEYKNIFDIKYLQPFNVKDIQITAFNSGNSLGASIYKITSNLENIYIGYNLNHRKENHLNGVDIKKIIDSYVFITNSKYCYKENINFTVRNEQFLTIIKNLLNSKPKKVIIYVTYPRFHEIAMILNTLKSKKIVVVNNHIEKFINKSKNMIEWSNSKLIEENDVYEYKNIECIEYFSKLDKFDICILLDEDITLLDKFNDENLSVIFIDKKFDFINKPIFSYKGSYEIISETKKEDLISESSEEEVESHWSIHKYEIKFDNEGNLQEETAKLDLVSFEDVFSNFYGVKSTDFSINNKIFKISDKLIFEKNKKLRNFDNYGEYIDKEKFVIKVEKVEVFNEEIPSQKVYVETKEIKKIGIKPKFKTILFNLQGTSDLKNIKVILQNIESKKLIIVDDDPVVSKFFFNNLLCSIKDVEICQSPINLNSSTNINIVNVSDVINNMENEEIKLKDTKIFRFVGKKENETIKFLKIPEKICTCDFNSLKKKLSSINLKIEKNENSFIIQDKIIVRLENDRIILDGEEGEVFYYIRNLLYENILYI